MSSPSTPTSSGGARSVSDSFVESPTTNNDTAAEENDDDDDDDDDTFVKSIAAFSNGAAAASAASAATSTAATSSIVATATTPTTPTAAYPEFVTLPDFPSLSEADVPSSSSSSGLSTNASRKESLNDSNLSATGAVFLDDPSVDSSKGKSPSRQSRVSSPREKSSSSAPPLAAPLQALVDKLVDMGFDVGVTTRAVTRFGKDEKQVIDHLCVTSLLSEEGYSLVDAEEALLLNEGKEKQARKFIKALTQLRQLGFEDSKIKAALVAADNDTEKALDQLMVT